MRLLLLPARAASALVSGVVVVATLGQPPEGAMSDPDCCDCGRRRTEPHTCRKTTSGGSHA